MTPDEYLNAILIRETVNTGPSSPVRGVAGSPRPNVEPFLEPLCAERAPKTPRSAA